ncbi:hypothetical protein [Ruminococcus sp.]|uniref:hypothetical protein n=1 Tax=Ruminococcus sp. TaxID=41978 RepID=UPI00388D9EE0
MKAKTILKALSTMTRQRHFFGKGLIKSYVSLLLVLILGVTSTIAWFTEREAAHLNSENLEFQSASSLRINKDKYSANKITIPAFTLDEASSLDGRNIYFPVGESFTSNTAEMFFREGNKGDENVHYVYKDFELKGTSGNTPVYIKSYKIQVGDDIYEDELKVEDDAQGKPNKQVKPPDHCPVRLAFIADSGVKPVVIDPSAQVDKYVDNSPGVVSLVDDNGNPTLEPSYPNYNWNSFSTYYYEHTPLFVIPGGQKLNVTLVVWLEGSLEDLDSYKNKEISVDIDIESNFAAMDTIKFVDASVGDDDSSDSARYWVSDKDAQGYPIILACSYEDPYSEETPKRWKTVIMRQTKQGQKGVTGGEWECEIPKKATTNISFYRLTGQNGSSQATIYNAWYTRIGVMGMINPSINNSTWLTNGDLQGSRTFFDTSTNTNDNALVYTAIHGNGYSSTNVESQRLSPCVGYWNFTAGSGSSSSGGGQSSGGGGSTNTNCNVTVTARIPNDIAGNKAWVMSNSVKLGFVTDNGGKYYFDSFSNNTAEKTFSIAVGEKILKFIMNNGSSDYYEFPSTQTFTVPDSTSWNVTYKLNNNDTWTRDN